MFRNESQSDDEEEWDLMQRGPGNDKSLEKIRGLKKIRSR
jgi:hypothetical protein